MAFLSVLQPISNATKNIEININIEKYITGAIDGFILVE